MLDDILSQVQKPGRYIGQEWNILKKDFDKAEIKFALCFPDLYEVGMSNLGLRIIYGILNSIADISCERFFSCPQDMKEALRNNNSEIFSLENKRRLGEFDLIGFSLGYELGYTNVLDILESGKIPLRSSLRGHTHPLVIAGGPCTINPEPMHEFFDLFVIGEAEEVILELVDIYRKSKDKFRSAKLGKDDLLIMFAGLEGVYVPSLYKVAYTGAGKIREFKPKVKGIPARIKKRFVKDLDSAYFPRDWLIPHIQIVHDRVVLEIMRGCPNRCRFCQARSQYFPFRQKTAKNILGLALSAYACTGYEEISLGGLSVSEHSEIEEVSRNLVALFKAKGVSISLPSIKPRAIVGNLSAMIAAIKKTGLTFAPEAATERLRGILNKNFDLEEFWLAMEKAYLCGYQHVKLYFMVGLPYERDEDLNAILAFAERVSELRKKIMNRPAQVNISINTLIPKPHTPLERLAMPDLDTISFKERYLKKQTKSKRLKLDFHDPHTSILEALLSRGDRRLSEVILNAFNKGARFDAWREHFFFKRWMDAFYEAGIEPNFYLREKARDEILPWDFLDIGISKDVLEDEFNKVIAGEEDR